MTRQVRAVFFDIGGVVVTSPLIPISVYEKERNLPPDYLNVQIKSRGDTGAWQRFERGELQLFEFYRLFGGELSDSAHGNDAYRAHCRKRGLDCPHPLPSGDLGVDGRELFGRMMRGGGYDDVVVEAIRRLRATGKYLVIALTNNFTAPFEALQAQDAPLAAKEMSFLGWHAAGLTANGGPASADLKAMFDDFVDSSVVGKRKPEPGFFLYACEKHGLRPEEVVFLDDLPMNLKVARELGMQTIHVPIGRSYQAIRELGDKLGGVDLLSSSTLGPQTPASKM